MQGLLTGCLSLAGGLGAYVSSLLLKSFSRIQCYQIIGVATIFICVLMLTGNITTLLIGRVVQGIIIGITSALNPLYVR